SNTSKQLARDCPVISCIFGKIELKDRIVNIACGGFHSLALTQNSEIYAWGKNNYGQLGLGDYIDRSIPCKLNLKDIKLIDCASSYSMAVNGQGKVWSW